MKSTTEKNEFVSGSEILDLLPFPLDRASVVRMSRTGAFPAIAVTINSRRFLWLRKEVEEWIRERWPKDAKHTEVPRRGSR